MRCLRTVLILVCLAVFLPAAVSAEPADAREDWDGRIDTLVTSMRRYYEAAGEAEKIAPYGETVSVSPESAGSTFIICLRSMNVKS